MGEHVFRPDGRRWELAGHGAFESGRKGGDRGKLDAGGRHLAVRREGNIFKGRYIFSEEGGGDVGSFDPDGMFKNTAQLTIDDRRWRCESSRKPPFVMSGDGGELRFTVGRDAIEVDGDADSLTLVVGGWLAKTDHDVRRRRARRRRRNAAIAGAAGSGGASG